MIFIKNKELTQHGHLWNFVNYAGSKKEDQNDYKTLYPPSILTRICFSWEGDVQADITRTGTTMYEDLNLSHYFSFLLLSSCLPQ